MTIANLERMTMPNVAAWISQARGLFRPPSDAVMPQSARMSMPQDQQTPSEVFPNAAVCEQSRYARLLEREQDRAHLTAVEREDTETLDRVRAALYQD